MTWHNITRLDMIHDTTSHDTALHDTAKISEYLQSRSNIFNRFQAIFITHKRCQRLNDHVAEIWNTNTQEVGPHLSAELQILRSSFPLLVNWPNLKLTSNMTGPTRMVASPPLPHVPPLPSRYHTSPHLPRWVCLSVSITAVFLRLSQGFLAVSIDEFFLEK